MTSQDVRNYTLTPLQQLIVDHVQGVVDADTFKIVVIVDDLPRVRMPLGPGVTTALMRVHYPGPCTWIEPTLHQCIATRTKLAENGRTCDGVARAVECAGTIHPVVICDHLCSADQMHRIAREVLNADTCKIVIFVIRLVPP